jgi:hypothetical protein
MNMYVAPLSKEEKKWLKDLQNILDKCPSDRMECYTIGDNSITIYDIAANNSEEAENLHKGSNDWCNVIDATDTELTTIKFPFAVLSTAG